MGSPEEQASNDLAELCEDLLAAVNAYDGKPSKDAAADLRVALAQARGKAYVDQDRPGHGIIDSPFLNDGFDGLAAEVRRFKRLEQWAVNRIEQHYPVKAKAVVVQGR